MTSYAIDRLHIVEANAFQQALDPPRHVNVNCSVLFQGIRRVGEVSYSSRRANFGVGVEAN